MRKKKKATRIKKMSKIKKSYKDKNDLVKKDMETISNEELPKKDYIERKTHIWCREKDHRISIALCDRDCKFGFCSERLEVLDDESGDYQSLNGKVIKKAVINEETQRRLYIYLDDGRLIKILGGFTIHDEQPTKETHNNGKRKLIKKEINFQSNKIIKKPILKENKILKGSIQNNRPVEKPSINKIIKKKLIIK